MTENDFYVAIQYILERAMNEGWPLAKIEECGNDAVDEFIGVHTPETEDF